MDEIFDEWVDKPNDLTRFVMSVAEENDFNEKKYESEIRKYFTKLGAEDESLAEMMDGGMKVFEEIILPNKSELFSHLKQKSSKLKLPIQGQKKLSSIKKKPIVESDEENTKETKSSSSSDNDDKKTTKRKQKKKVTKEPKPVRAYDLFQKDVKNDVKEELKGEWEKKYPDVPYNSNPTVVSREIGRRWREDLSTEERKVYEKQAAEINESNGFEPKGKKQVDESDKKPMTSYQFFNKEKYDEMAAKYRKDNKLGKNDKVKPTEVMKLTAQLWNQVKADPEREKEYQEKADAYNKEKGRVAKPKVKEAKVSDKKTNAYHMFCVDFRKNYRKENPDGNHYEEARLMNEEWNTKVKQDEDLMEHWKNEAEAENKRRGHTEESN